MSLLEVGFQAPLMLYWVSPGELWWQQWGWTCDKLQKSSSLRTSVITANNFIAALSKGLNPARSCDVLNLLLHRKKKNNLAGTARRLSGISHKHCKALESVHGMTVTLPAFACRLCRALGILGWLQLISNLKRTEYFCGSVVYKE